MKREIIIKVNFELNELNNEGTTITRKEKVEEMVIRDMESHFGWDEGYNGVEVSVIDSE